VGTIFIVYSFVAATAYRQIKDYECLEILNRKPVRFVCRARCKVSGILVALKVFNKRELSHSDCDHSPHLSEAQVRREIALHSSLQHPGVCQLYAAFEDNRTIVLVLELCRQGSLAERLERGRIPDALGKQVLRELFAALSYIHSRGVLHRDISPGNLLFGDDGKLRIADFGLAVDMRCHAPRNAAGTVYYCAPEVLRPLVDPHIFPTWDYGLQADVWSCGVIAYEVLTGAPLFDEDLDREITMRKIASGDLRLPQPLSAAEKAFLGCALQVDPAARATVDQLANHKWLVEPCRKRRLNFLGSGLRLRRTLSLIRED